MTKIPVTESTEDGAKSGRPQDRSASKKGVSATEARTSSTQDEDEKLQTDLDRFRDLALRSQADFENYKKRAAREKEDAIKYANSGLLDRLLPIIDNFELGLEAARGEGENSAVFSGMNMVLKQLMDFLIEHGVQPIDAVGQAFDPNLHEAIAHEPNDEVAENVIIRQSRRGYRWKDRLLRPSSVIVSSGPV
jgi:molecular chaperone GrpE